MRRLSLIIAKPNMPLAAVKTLQPLVATEATDDLAREVFGLLGLPLDFLNFPNLLRSIDIASDVVSPYLISTPNVNFLVTSRRNSDFRESLLRSDVCIADGMPLIWIAKLLRIPIRERVTGADLFETLKLASGRNHKLRVFLFGGGDGVAETVRRSLNASSAGLECVGALNPGFGTIDDMSTDRVIDTINSSGADLLAVFLGAEKAQTWLLRNHDRIKIPIRAQFGAAINFEAGTIKRAPAFFRNSGFEWLWRIKEEPYLWRRYWTDGLMLLRLLFTDAIPLAVYCHFTRLWGAPALKGLRVDTREDERSVTVSLSGQAVSQNIDDAIDGFRTALSAKKDMLVDCSMIQMVDPRFVGLVLMVRKQLVSGGRTLRFLNMTPAVRRAVRLNGFEFLLSTER
jgi:N-acetylglucosaminyldiphosphoundecaprenol N-acetyl-beta-D-mannosaminyltransferase